MPKFESNAVVDSFQAFLVEGAKFTAKEEYPIIREDMVPAEPPKKVLPFSKAITFHGDLSDCVVDFYSPDGSFERVRKNPKRYLGFLHRCQGIIGPDFSIHSDMPLIMQKSQMNDILSLSFYYANNGIPLYPNCRGGSDCLNEEFLEALPRNSYLALGVHGFVHRKDQKHEWRDWISAVIDTLNPKGFIVVGHLPKDVVEDFEDKVEFHIYDAYIETRWKEVKNDVD